MEKKKIISLVANSVGIAVVAAALVVGNTVVSQFENEISTLIAPPIVDNEALEASSAKGQELSKRIMEEGAVLLKNDGNTLPLDRGSVSKVNVFGWRSIDWIYGSEGANASGGVAPEDDDFSKNVDIYKALQKYGIGYNTEIYDMYYRYQAPNHQSADLRGTHISNLIPLIEPNINDKSYYTDSLLENAKNYSNTALVSINRMAGEGMECSTSMQRKKGPGAVDDATRHYLELSTEEEALLTYVGANYENVVVLINAANPFECGFLDTIPGIDACMYVGFTGTRAAAAIPELLWGEVSPSGHTVDTFAYDFFTNPANIWIGGLQYADYGWSYSDYIENIYVGYKWYETADSLGYWNDVNNSYGTGYEGVVQFPFGYGLSYTDFSWTVGDIELAPGSELDGVSKFKLPVTVKNEGSHRGRDVVEVYLNPPYKTGEIEKSTVNLVGFGKTSILEPGQEETIEIEIDQYNFASYDCYDKNNNGFKGFELDDGTYTLSLRTDSHTIKEVTYKGTTGAGNFDYVVTDTVKIENDPVTGKLVNNKFTGEDAIDRTPLDSKEGDFDPNIPWLSRTGFPSLSEITSSHVARNAAPSAKSNIYDTSRADAWNNRTTDEFGNPVPTTAPTWKNGGSLRVTDAGVINQLGQELGENYDDPRWEELLNQISIEEAVNVVNNYYGTKAIDSVGKPFLADLDGPSQIKGFNYAPRGTGYPTMVVIASTWNQKLAKEFGKSYGDDMKSLGIYGVWGWAIDNHRTSFFGRNHESPSEDSVLSGLMISNACKGLNTRGRYAFIKHFAIYGYAGDHIYLTEQSFRENYLRAFRMAFVDGGALGCMTTYRGIGSEHSETTIALLQGVLRNEWDFKGAITTDYITNANYCEAIIRARGSLGMGCRLSDSFNSTANIRFQHNLRMAMKDVLYMWLHADYYERYFIANPDEEDSTVVSSSINSWNWLKPFLTTVNVVAISGLVVWGSFIALDVFMPKKKKDENGGE